MQTFFEDNNGNIWIGTNGGGVTVFEKSSQRTINFIHSGNNPNSLSHNRIWDIAQDTDNTIWVATGNGLDHISSLDEASVSRLNSNLNNDSLLHQQRIRRLLISDAGQFWIGTEEGLCVMDSLRKSCNEISEFNGNNYPDIRITSITQGNDNQLWVGTLSGLYLLNTQQRSVVPLVSTNKYPLLPHDDIRDIYYDTAGILWIASRPSGLVKISFIGDSISGFTQFTDDQNRSQDIGRVHALLVDKQEQLWIGSTQGLLKMSSAEEGPKRYDDSLGLIDTMLEDRSGNIWVGSSNGLFRKAANEQEFQNQKSKFPDEQNYYVATMFEDSNGNLWIGTTHNGLLRLNGNKITPVVFDELPQLPQSTIAAIIEDRHQFIVVAIVGFGIFRFSPDSEKFSTYRSGDMGDLHGNGVIDLLVDNTNTLWVATDNKLNQLDDIANIFHYFPQQQRSKSLAIKAMLNDTNNHIWFSSADGIYQLNTSTNSIDHYTSSNGLHGDQFVNKSGFATSKGELFFGGTSGFSRIQTADLDKKNAESKMTISRIKADDSDIMFARNRTIDTNQFTHTLKDIQFTFTDLSLLSNNTAKYRYRLIGHKSTWSTRSDQSSASYSGLSPG
ncbi:hypothetical protein OAP14_10430 [Aliiglaciecola sp.]|nr:hypothetical protein [Aliiglaciecola sp.]